MILHRVLRRATVVCCVRECACAHAVIYSHYTACMSVDLIITRERRKCRAPLTSRARELVCVCDVHAHAVARVLTHGKLALIREQII